MNLPKGNQWPERRCDLACDAFRTTATARDCAYRMEKRSAIALDGSAGVVFGEAVIEAALAVGARGAADTGRKSMHEPGKLA